MLSGRPAGAYTTICPSTLSCSVCRFLSKKIHTASINPANGMMIPIALIAMIFTTTSRNQLSPWLMPLLVSILTT